MKRILLILLILPFVSRAQVINPVPDMVFKGQLSAGRSTGTDSSAYMSIGPSRGATKGFMAPMVSDTNAVYQPRRDGLLIFSLQRRNFLYWDSLAVRWREFAAGGAVDTLTISTRAWRQKGVDSVRSLPRVTFVTSGLGMKFDTIKTSGSVSVDTVIMSTRARVQKPVDSLGSVKQDKITLTTLGTTGPATLAGSVLNIPNYSPGVGFLRNIAPIGSVPNANGMSKFGDTLRLQPASATFGGVVTIGNQTFSGEKIFNERVRVGVSGGATIQNTDQFSVGIGNNSLSSSLNTVSNNTALGYNSGSSNVAGQSNVFVGSRAGDLISTGQGNTNSIGGVFVGADARPLADGQTNQIVIGSGARGNGSNTTTIGTNSTTKTYLKGGLNVSTIDSVAPTSSLLFASGNDVVRSGRVPISAIDTSVIGTKAWRQKGVDSLAAAKQNNLTLTTSGSSGASTLVNSTLNVPNYTLAGLGGVPTNRVITINGESLDLSADRSWTISGAGSGTVTSVTGGYGITGGTITVSGTLAADTSVMATRPRVQKGIDSVAALPRVTGTGISGYMTRWSGSNAIDTSQIFQQGNRIGIGTTTPAYRFDIPYVSNGDYARINNLVFGRDGNGPTLDPEDRPFRIYGQGKAGYIYGSTFGGIGRWGFNTTTINNNLVTIAGSVSIGEDSVGIAGPANGIKIQGRAKIHTIDSTSSAVNMLYQDLDGTIKKSAVPAGGAVDSLLFSTRSWRQKGIDSVVNLIASSGGGTVLSVSAGTGMNFPTITSTGSVSVDTVIMSTRARVQKPVDSLGAIKQNNISLTTTGSSGASTFSSNVLNVPNYTLSGLGGVPTSRTLTINGATYDLSADRSWTISGGGAAGVTSVASGLGMNFSTITTTGTVSADTNVLASRAWRQKGIDSVNSVKQDKLSLTTTGSSGASTLVGSTLNVPNYTLSGLGGVPTSRTLTINGVSYDLSSDRSWTISGGGGSSGTVTAVTGGYGLTGGTITVSGTLALDTAAMATRARVQKGIDSVAALPRITGTGVSGYMARWTGASTQDTSRIFQSGNLVGINTTSPSERLDVDGKVRVRTIDSSASPINMLWSDATGVIRKTAVPAGGTVTSVGSGFGTNFSTITSTGSVVVDSVIMATRARVQKAIDSLSSVKQNNLSLTTTGSSGAATLVGSTLNVPNYTLSGLGGVPTSRTLTINGTAFDLSADRSWTISAGSGTVTSVGTGYGLTGGTITTTGTVVADTNQLSSKAWRQKAVDTINATRVPNGRTLTINGTSFDLSANRTWTIATGADMDSTSLTIASGWQFARDLTTANSINELVKTNKGDIMTITLQGVVYKTTSTFSTGSWVTVATVPSGWRPNHTVYGSLPNLVTGTEYENISGTDFADDAFYEGACAYRILTNGNIQVRVDTVTSSATLSGANYVIFPIHIVYIVQFIPV